MTSPKVLKTFNLIKIGVLWVWKNLWGYGRKVHAKFWPWGMPWDRVMTTFGSYVDPHFPYREYFAVYGGLQALGGISFFFSLNFPSNAIRIMSGDPLGPEL